MDRARSPRRRDGLSPGGRVAGDVRVPGSKSIAQRALVAAALAHGTTRITGLPSGEDVVAARALVAAAGAEVRALAPAAVTVTGRPPGPHRGWSADAPLDAGESGTLARLATAAAAFGARAGRDVEITARGTLLGRASPPLFAALRAAGVGVHSSGARDGAWPVRLRPIGPPNELALVAPVSSQEVTALLVALAAYPDTIELAVVGPIPSRPYVAITLGTLRDFGVRLEERVVAGGTRFLVRGPLVAPSEPLRVEPDASSAAVALAAACLGDGEVRVPGLGADARQGDVRIVEHLRAFGCDARRDAEGLVARGIPTRGADLDLGGEPDLAPVLAIVAAAAALRHGARSRLVGLETLAGKESPRVDVLAAGLAAVGIVAEHDAGTLTVTGACTRAPRGPIVLDARDDHRMAFAFALLGLLVDGVVVDGADCVAKSWPDAFEALERAGARRLAATIG